MTSNYNTIFAALAGVAQWIECQTANQRVQVQFPVRAPAWVAGPGPQSGCVRGNHTLMFLSLSPSVFLSKKKFKNLKKILYLQYYIQNTF